MPTRPPDSAGSAAPNDRRVRRVSVLALAGALVLAIVAAGCSAEDPAQRYVRQHVADHVATLPGYEPANTHCTSTPRPWLVERSTEVYLCAVRRTDGDCDLFSGRLVGRDVTVTLQTRKAGCILPP